jgi:hypothetical protein
MSSRYGYLTLLGIGLACQLGCCGWNWGPAGTPCQRTWFGSQCGCVVWSEWFSFPPRCRDACSCCGDFTASNNPYVLNGPSEARFGPIYDDGGSRGKGRGEYYQDRGSMQPTPATRQSEPEPVPMGEPTTRRRNSQDARGVSYDQPIDSLPSSRKLERPPYRYAR